MNGVEVADSPFPVFASIHPSQLGKPVQVISGVSRPSGVACNSEGEIILCEYHGDVVLLDKKGNRLASIKKSDHNLNQLRGVAVDGDDNICFVEEGKNIIYKSDKQMKKITSKTTNQKGVPGHWCVAVVGDEVMVCDNNQENINILVSTCGNSTACCLLNQEACCSLLLYLASLLPPPPPPLPPPTHPWRKLVQQHKTP